jgi:hypothetical protein
MQALTLWLIVCSPIAQCHDKPPEQLARERCEAIQQRFGVRVHFEYDREKFFPEEWRKEPISARATQVDVGETLRVYPIIETFLSRYSRETLDKYLKDIYLVKRMYFYEKSYGGTNSSDAVYMTVDNAAEGYTDTWLLGSFHHEFSSIFFRDAGFPADEWTKVNDPSWKYIGSGEDIVTEQGLQEHSEERFEKGFLIRYSEASMEEDFNNFVEYLFIDRPMVLSAAAKHPRIWKKLQIVIRFYGKVDPSFSFD